MSDPACAQWVRQLYPEAKPTRLTNPAWVAVHFGFEVQIDELGQPDGADIHKTGAIYNEPGQTLSIQASRPPGQWNEFEIRVQGQNYTVRLNGAQVTQFVNADAGRGRASTPAAPSYLGLQAYSGRRVQFRNIRIKAEVPVAPPVATPRRSAGLTAPAGKQP